MSDLRTDRGSRPVPGEADQQGGSPKRMITAAIALGAVAAFGIGIWFAYDQGVKRGASGAPPLIHADQGPTKVAPENPGGMQVPNQDKQIYDRIGGNVPPADDGKTERLLPPPERPSAVATAPAAGGTATSPAVTVPTRPAPSAVPGQAPAGAGGIPNQTNAPSPAPVPPAAKAPEPKTAETAAKPAEPKPAAKPAEAPAKTASLASPGGSAKVQLASLKDQADAQATWSRLQKKFPDLLNGLTPHYEKVEIPNKGTFVRLQAGPLKDRAAAQSLCQQLAAKNQGCIVVR